MMPLHHRSRRALSSPLRMLFLLTLLCLAPIAAAVHAQTEAAWTILYYSAADNDLEPFMIGDLVEMQAAGSTADVNIVVQIDRADGYDEVTGDWTDTRRFLIEQAVSGASSGDFLISPETFFDSLRSLDLSNLNMSPEDLEAEIDAVAALPPEEFDQFYLTTFGAPPPGGIRLPALQQNAIETLGEVNMGDPAELVDFATWGIQNYPAQRYALVISNHGGGWLGVAFDEDSADDMLSMPELADALAQITAQTGIGRFDLIGFDACLMSQYEVLAILEPYADYAIIAQETIPGAGWEYVTPLLALTEQPDMAIDAFGQIVIDSYMRYYTEDMAGYDAFDLHLFDLAKLADLTAAIEGFAAAVAANPDANLRPIGQARDNAQVFAADDPSAVELYASVDLANFMDLLAQLTDDSAVQNAARAVIAAVDTLEVYGRASDGLPGSNGVAIYFPRNGKRFDSIGAQKYVNETGMTTWTSFLETVHGTAEQTFAPANLTINIREVLPADDIASIYDPPVIVFETDGEGVVDISFFASLQLPNSGNEIILDQSPLEFPVVTVDGDEIDDFPEGASTNEFAWNVEMPVLSDGQNSVEALLNVGEEDATVEGLYHYAEGDTVDAYLVFDLETRTMQSVWGVQGGANQSGQATGEIAPRRGDSFEPYWLFLSPEGEVQYSPSQIQLYFSTDPFTYQFVPAASGTYTFAMVIEDMAGNISQDEIEFTVDNAGLDPNYRGFKDIQTGVNFLYPWTWTNPTVVEDEEGGYTLNTRDQSGEFSIIVNNYESVGIDDITDFALDLLDGLGADYDDPEDFTIEALPGTYGGDASIIEYSYEDADGEPRFGLGLVVYIAETQTGYIIDVDAPEAEAAAANDIFDVLLDSVVFFEQYNP